MNAVKMGLTIEEAAECTGIGRNTMRKLVEWGKLPVLKVGRKTIIRRDTLERFLTVNQGRNLLKPDDVMMSAEWNDHPFSFRKVTLSPRRLRAKYTPRTNLRFVLRVFRPCRGLPYQPPAAYDTGLSPLPQRQPQP